MWEAWDAMAARVTEMTPPSTVVTSTVLTRREKSARSSVTTRPTAVMQKQTSRAIQYSLMTMRALATSVQGPAQVRPSAASVKTPASDQTARHKRLKPPMTTPCRKTLLPD